MDAIASAGAVVEIRERGMEVRVGFNEVRDSVCGPVRIHVIHVHAIAQDVVREYIARRSVARAALAASKDSAHRHAQSDIDYVIGETPSSLSL